MGHSKTMNERNEKRWTRASGPNFVWTSLDPLEGLWVIKISKICLHQISIFINCLNILKIHELFLWNPRNYFVLFHNVHKENMFTIKIGDVAKRPKSLVYQKGICMHAISHFIIAFFCLQLHIMAIMKLSVFHIGWDFHDDLYKLL